MSSTTLATGQTVTLTGDTGVYFVVSTSGGLASMTVTPVNGRPETENIGPLPYRRTWGPYKDGATAVIVNQTAPALAYEQLSEVGGGVQSPVSGGAASLYTKLAAGTEVAAGDNVHDLDAGVANVALSDGTAVPSPSAVLVGPWTTGGIASFRVHGLTSQDFMEQYATNYLRGRGARIQAGLPTLGATSGWCIEWVTDSPLFSIACSGTPSIVSHLAVGTPGMRNMRLVSANGYTRPSALSDIKVDWSAHPTPRKLRGYRMYMTQDQGFGRITLGANDTIYAPGKSPMRLLDIGDSFIANTLSPTSIPSNLYGIPACSRELTGCDVVGQGIGSSGYINGNVLSNVWRIEDAAAANADLIRVWLGGNDMSNGGPAIQVAATAALVALRASVGPSVPILVFGPNPSNANLSAQLLATEAAIKAAVESIADTKMVFVPVNDPSVGYEATGQQDTNTTTGATGNSAFVTGDDGVHPSAYGAVYIARRRLRSTLNTLRAKNW